MKNVLIAITLIFLSTSAIQAQEVKGKVDNTTQKNNLKGEVKESLNPDTPNPDLYIDGKKYDFEIFDLLDRDKIKSVFIVKDEQAIEEYNAPNGAVIVSSKKDDESLSFSGDVEFKIKKKKKKKDKKKKKYKYKDSDKSPMIIIDGEVSSKATLEKISPDDIESIDVVKGAKAITEYNAPYGVIIINMKEKKD